MNWLILLGEASDATPDTGDNSGFILQMVVIFVLIFGMIYFFSIRPQKKQREQHRQMMGALRKNDKVVTIGGIHGTVVSVKENYIVLKISDNGDVNIRVNPTAIGGVVSQSEEPEEE